MADLQLTQGIDFATAVVFRDRAEVALTTLLASDDMLATVWPGDDQAEVLVPTLTWLDASAARAQMSISGLDTAALEIGTYQGFITVVRSAETRASVHFTLELLPAPGSAVAAPVYGTHDEMLMYAPWLDKLQSKSDQTGFREARARARTWLDEMIVARWKGQTGGWFSGSTNTAYWTYATLGGSDAIPSQWLRDQLAAGALMVRADIKEIVARKAISLVCGSQLGNIEKSSYQALAALFERQANAVVKTCRAELDFNTDGQPDLIVNLGATNLR